MQVACVGAGRTRRAAGWKLLSPITCRTDLEENTEPHITRSRRLLGYDVKTKVVLRVEGTSVLRFCLTAIKKNKNKQEHKHIMKNDAPWCFAGFVIIPG